MKAWILIYTLSPLHSIEVAAYDTYADCDEVAYYLQQNLVDGATVECEVSVND
jgi:hypothetical protein